MNPALLLFITWAVMLGGFIVASDPLKEILLWVIGGAIAIGFLLWWRRQ
jgi:hypothetical protein